MPRGGHGGEASGLLRAVDGPTLLLCTLAGDVERHTVGGLYHHDTRYLSEWRLLVQGKPLTLLTSQLLDAGSQLFYLTNEEAPGLPVQAVTVRRQRTIGSGMAEQITVTSHLQQPVTLRAELVVDADFSSVLEVHRGYVEPTGSWRTERTGEGTAARWIFDHERFAAASEVSSSEPARVTVADRLRSRSQSRGTAPTYPARFHYDIELAPHQAWRTELQVTFQREQEKLEPIAERLASESPPAEEEPAGPAVRANWAVVEAVCTQSLTDLAALRFEAVVDDHRVSVPAAGIPWYLAIIGRDSLWTAYQALPFAPELAAGALTALAYLQATDRDLSAAAEPGKVLHELRFGKLTALGDKPFRPYYGTVDATMLFLIVLAEYWQVTGDTTLCRRLRANALAALDWLDTYADPDADGFIEYQRHAPHGARNHCWKDSPDSMRFADGRVAEEPIAVCEAQGYAYAARLRMAEVAGEIWGDAPLARRLREDASRLYDQFNDRFWIDWRGGYYALALDGDKAPVDSVTSNMGHLLWSGIVPPERAETVAARLAGPDMFSGWGVRTMSSEDQGFSPISYHNGSVWPHDNAIAAAGLARYGFRAQAADIAVAIFEAAERLDEGDRLPEVYTGHPRSEAVFPVWYPQAACPQGWAAAAPLLLVRTLLGLEFSRGQARNDPFLPPKMHGLSAAGPPAAGGWQVRSS
jgi:glycogen debranching enzyme